MIRKRGKSYEVRVYDPRTGKRLYGTRKTQREAKELHRELEARAGRPGTSETVKAFAERWQREYPRPEASTREHIKYALRPLLAQFGSRPMRSISRQEARAWAISVPWRNAARTARAMFNDAIDNGVIAENPFARLGFAESRGRKDLVVVAPRDLTRLAEVAVEIHGDWGHMFAAMILFAAYVGVRPAELFALRWDDVDLRRLEVHVRRQRRPDGLAAPKNKQARTITLPPPARDALVAMHRTLDEHVFVTKTGRPFTKGTHYYAWHSVRCAFGRPNMDFYELRHFCATHLLERGASHADVAVQLGHTDGGKLVMSTYGHPSEEAARERLRQAFAEPTKLEPVADRSQAATESAS